MINLVVGYKLGTPVGPGFAHNRKYEAILLTLGSNQGGFSGSYGMANNFSWSMSIGRCGGTPVRVHLLLFLFVATIFGSSSLTDPYLTALVTTIVLLVSIVAHEFAHVFALRNLGGHVDTLVLLPWGGNSRFVMPETSRSKAIVHLAGPFVNGAIFLFCTALLIRPDSSGLWWDQCWKLIAPLGPHSIEGGGEFVSFIKIVAWVNFQLLIVNLIPCFPFDGAGAVRAWIGSLNADLPKYRVESAIKLIGDASAFVFVGLAWFVKDTDAGPVEPTWLLFLIVGITLLFASRYSMNRELEAHELDWDDVGDMDYGSLHDEPSFLDFSDSNEESAYSQWLQEKQEARREVEMQVDLVQDEDEDQQADEILKKLHLGGISAITHEERTILDRVSARIRRRRQQGV
ncbi:MAG: Zn-dependent protease [Mariniblastus sp.]